MTSRCWPGLVLVVTLSIADPEMTQACSCPGSGPPCQAAWAADAIFSGTVRSIEVMPEQLNGGIPARETMIRFELAGRFLNVPTGPVEIVTDTFSTCSYRFAVGESYLVYARRRDDGRLTTERCSRTRPITEAAEDVKYLSALPAAGAGARVYGRINEWVHHPADAQGVDHGPLENITVSVRSAGLSRDLLTDRNGEYELQGVPLGVVSISVATPFGFAPDTPREFEVRDLRSCIAADFTLRAESAAHGVVVDEAGRPLSGILIEAVAAELAGYRPEMIFEPVKSDDRGRFAFEGLPSGIYVFGVNITKGRHKPPPGPATFLPGTAVSNDAAIFELKPGDRADVGVLRLISR